MAFDYSKWDNIELSDDDDESCHPNIDKNLWRRIKKRDRDERDAKIAAEKEQLSKEVEVTKFEMAQLTKQLEETGVDASAVKKKIEELRSSNSGRLEKLADIELNKKYNADNMCTVVDEKTVINSKPSTTDEGYVIPDEPEPSLGATLAAEAKKTIKETAKVHPEPSEAKKEEATPEAEVPMEDSKKGEEPTKQEKAQMLGYNEYVKKHKALLEKFMFMTSMDETQELLKKHASILFQEHASSFMLLSCLEEEMEGRRAKMKRVARQSQVLSSITAYAKQMQRHPGSFVDPFFKGVKKNNEFETSVQGFVQKIIDRAIEKKKEQEEEVEYETTEVKLSDLPVEERLGPGGLDPVEVFESLPEELQKAFTTREIEPLKQALMNMKPEDAEYHMERCTKAGLWNAEG